jgi:hypothetical protein
MKRAALLLPAIAATALLPALGAQAATSCSDELRQLAQTYHLSLSPRATAQAGNSAEQRGAGSSQSGTASELEKIQGMMSQRQGSTGQGTGEPGTGGTAAAPNNTAEAPATTESRGMAAGLDSLESSGGTLPPAASSSAQDQHRGATAADQLGPADRAKAEGMLSQAQAADAQGKGDQCLQFLRTVQSMLKARQ